LKAIEEISVTGSRYALKPLLNALEGHRTAEVDIAILIALRRIPHPSQVDPIMRLMEKYLEQNRHGYCPQCKNLIEEASLTLRTLATNTRLSSHLLAPYVAHQQAPICELALEMLAHVPDDDAVSILERALLHPPSVASLAVASQGLSKAKWRPKNNNETARFLIGLKRFGELPVVNLEAVSLIIAHAANPETVLRALGQAALHPVKEWFLRNCSQFNHRIPLDLMADLAKQAADGDLVLEALLDSEDFALWSFAAQRLRERNWNPKNDVQQVKMLVGNGETPATVKYGDTTTGILTKRLLEIGVDASGEFKGYSNRGLQEAFMFQATEVLTAIATPMARASVLELALKRGLHCGGLASSIVRLNDCCFLDFLVSRLDAESYDTREFAAEGILKLVKTLGPLMPDAQLTRLSKLPHTDRTEAWCENEHTHYTHSGIDVTAIRQAALEALAVRDSGSQDVHVQ